ncbi:MAG: esterase [Firmicutes bacterium]|nr:esterase [Bacillota bacterium]
MDKIQITSVPEEYQKAAPEGMRGRIVELSYPVRNYINRSRQLVTDRLISSEEAGRETVPGEAIVKKVNLYLPPGYDEKDKDKKYNLLYLLHGVGGNRFEWLYGSGRVDGNFVIANLFDNLILNGDLEPLIVVFPEGRSAEDWENTAFTPDETNLLGFYYFDYELRYDLIPFIEANFNTYANIEDKSAEAMAVSRKHRAIAGLSMGGMQALNLTLGGYRYDSIKYTKTTSVFGNGLDKTVKTPGMLDLFTFVGAFSNAPTSSDGKTLGVGIASSNHGLDLLYLTCGDADEISFQSGYARAIDGLSEAAGDMLAHCYQVVVAGGVHDFGVWNNGAYNFARLAFGKLETCSSPQVVKIEIR